MKLTKKILSIFHITIIKLNKITFPHLMMKAIFHHSLVISLPAWMRIIYNYYTTKKQEKLPKYHIKY